MTESNTEPAQVGESKMFRSASAVLLSERSDSRCNRSIPGTRMFIGLGGCWVWIEGRTCTVGKVSRGETPRNEEWRRVA